MWKETTKGEYFRTVFSFFQGLLCREGEREERVKAREFLSWWLPRIRVPLVGVTQPHLVQ